MTTPMLSNAYACSFTASSHSSFALISAMLYPVGPHPTTYPLARGTSMDLLQVSPAYMFLFILITGQSLICQCRGCDEAHLDMDLDELRLGRQKRVVNRVVVVAGTGAEQISVCQLRPKLQYHCPLRRIRAGCATHAPGLKMIAPYRLAACIWLTRYPDTLLCAAYSFRPAASASLDSHSSIVCSLVRLASSAPSDRSRKRLWPGPTLRGTKTCQCFVCTRFVRSRRRLNAPRRRRTLFGSRGLRPSRGSTTSGRKVQDMA